MPKSITDTQEGLYVLLQDRGSTTYSETKLFVSQATQTNLEDCVEHAILCLQNDIEDDCVNKRCSKKRKYNKKGNKSANKRRSKKRKYNKTDDTSELEKQQSMLEARLNSLSEESAEFESVIESCYDPLLKKRLKNNGYFTACKKSILNTTIELSLLAEKEHYDSLEESNEKYLKVPNVTNTEILDTDNPKLIYNELCKFYNNPCDYSTCYRSLSFTRVQYSQEYKIFGDASFIKTIMLRRNEDNNLYCAEINYFVNKSENAEDNTKITKYINEKLALFSQRCVEHDYDYTHNNFISMPNFVSVKNSLHL